MLVDNIKSSLNLVLHSVFVDLNKMMNLFIHLLLINKINKKSSVIYCAAK